MKKEIQNILVFSDSLTDRGTMANSALAAFSGLVGNSPHGRFTNGYVWLDYFIQRLRTNESAALTAPIFQKKNALFSVNTDEYVGTKTAPVFARTYCKGGMTAHDYSSERRAGKCFLNITAQVLETLDNLREEALRDDESMQLKDMEKLNTLVIEWSGANDLITINDKPTVKAADLAITSRITHINEMIKQGYHHFVLFNLPDLSLTPRYQNGDADLREQTHNSVEYFNEKLQEEILDLKILHPACMFHIFDANQLFVKAYNNPDEFDLHKKKRHTPFLSSSAFKDNDPDTTAEGYMFWDDVHPTEAVHVHLANTFYEQVFSPYYHFSFADQPLIRQFQKAYGMVWDEDKQGVLLGCVKKSKIDYLKSELTLDEIMHHGLFNKGKRTQRVMQSLGWVDDNHQCASDHPAVGDAWSRIQKKPASIEESDDAMSVELGARL